MYSRIFLMFTFVVSFAFAQNKSLILTSAQADNDEMRAKSIDAVATTNQVNAEAEKMRRNEFCRSLYKVVDGFPQDFSYLKGEKNVYGEWKSKAINNSLSEIYIKQSPEGEYSWTGNVTRQVSWQKANAEFQKITQTLRNCAVIKDFQPEENISMSKDESLTNKEGSNMLHTWTVVEPIETPYLGMQIATELSYKAGNWWVKIWIKKVSTF